MNNFGFGGVGILVARKWTDKIFNDDKATYWHWIAAIVLIYAPKKGLAEDVMDKFCEGLSPLSPLLVKTSWS